MLGPESADTAGVRKAAVAINATLVTKGFLDLSSFNSRLLFVSTDFLFDRSAELQLQLLNNDKNVMNVIHDLISQIDYYKKKISTLKSSSNSFINKHKISKSGFNSAANYAPYSIELNNNSLFDYDYDHNLILKQNRKLSNDIINLNSKLSQSKTQIDNLNSNLNNLKNLNQNLIQNFNLILNKNKKTSNDANNFNQLILNKFTNKNINHTNNITDINTNKENFVQLTKFNALEKDKSLKNLNKILDSVKSENAQLYSFLSSLYNYLQNYSISKLFSKSQLDYDNNQQSLFTNIHQVRFSFQNLFNNTFNTYS
ncbi:uncharacterized protein ASCRUDRAFT_152571 [Ascoidea rubescens DSM 1968]|uniref:Uncharacterized protein n=1 Tax=Ascoidea rubescens DSM 1968 TaxID=1344418 RepID=A0A1D2VGY0_9ASCO|nr:hypothetical protein ASCRUDRAFT_152571 [Ascoidea rubescens DSM 1968]ODV60918.1 hypothetical protein ASCRUDRAFT_152571 [Ascoidea rubescens DSM 1968]